MSVAIKLVWLSVVMLNVIMVNVAAPHVGVLGNFGVSAGGGI